MLTMVAKKPSGRLAHAMMTHSKGETERKEENFMPTLSVRNIFYTYMNFFKHRFSK